MSQRDTQSATEQATPSEQEFMLSVVKEEYDAEITTLLEAQPEADRELLRENIYVNLLEMYLRHKLGFFIDLRGANFAIEFLTKVANDLNSRGNINNKNFTIFLASV